MAKGQARGNREARKPKKVKPAEVPSTILPKGQATVGTPKKKI
jgi:hypothetical protein